MKTRFFYCIAVIIIMFFTACKKDSEKPHQQCRISSINLNGAEVTNFNYDEQDRVSVMTTGDVTTTYSYTAGGYVRQMLNANKLIEKSTAEFNAQGWIYKIATQRFDGSGNINFSATHSYEYNGSGEIVKSISKNGNLPEQTTTYTWNNGNLVQSSQGAIYTYYNDKPVQDGDILRINQLQAYGTAVINNKNLVKSVSQNSSAINVSYEFDNNGNISKCLLGNDYYIIQQVCQ